MPWKLRNMYSEDDYVLKLDELESDGYLPDVVSKAQGAHIRREGRFYCYRLLIRPPCECNSCGQQFRADSYQKRLVFDYTRVLLDDEARSEAASMVRNFRENLQYLRQQCETNGNAILKRSKKKSSEKRKNLLLEVDHDIYHHQWSDVRLRNEFIPIERANFKFNIAGSNPDATQGLARRTYFNICLLPYINLESSLENDSARLLNILHN